MRNMISARCRCLELAFSQYRVSGTCQFHTTCAPTCSCLTSEVKPKIVADFILLLANAVESDLEHSQQTLTHNVANEIKLLRGRG